MASWQAKAKWSIWTLTLEGMKKKKLLKGMRGGWGVNQTPPIFKSIQPIDMKLSMCNKCPVYFQ